MKAKLSDFSIDPFTRKQRITFTVDEDFRNQYDTLKDKDLRLDVKEWKQKRSLNANAYCWALLDQLADKLSDDKTVYTKEDLYRRAIREVGVFQDVELLPIPAKTMQHIWKEHGTGWFSEKIDERNGSVVIRFYYGSSSYNTKQMARLNDYIASDCEAVGINTMTPRERALLLDEWEKGKEK